MFQRSIKNLVYFQSNNKKGQTTSETSISEIKLQKLLETLSKQAMKEKTPSIEELESILQNSIRSLENEERSDSEIEKKTSEEGGTPITKFLRKQGYLKDGKNG